MNEEISLLLNKFPQETVDIFIELRQQIFSDVSEPIEEIMWAKLPTYCVGKSFVRLIPFKDHINIEAKAIIKYKDFFSDYKITPKGMLQIFSNQKIPTQILKDVFIETLSKKK